MKRVPYSTKGWHEPFVFVINVAASEELPAGYYYSDRDNENHGPYGTREEAQAAMDVYVKGLSE